MKYNTTNSRTPAIIIFQNRLDLLDATDYETIGKVVTALLHLNENGNIPDFERGTPEAMVFNCLYNDYKKNCEYYEEECRKKSEAGKKGGRASATVRWGTKYID